MSIFGKIYKEPFSLGKNEINKGNKFESTQDTLFGW